VVVERILNRGKLLKNCPEMKYHPLIEKVPIDDRISLT
jgi:hypothetical protein